MLLKYSKAPYSNVVSASLIDAALTIGFFVFLFSVLPEQSLTWVKSKLDVNLLILLGFVFYRMIFILLFDRTLGMKVFFVQFLDADQHPLNLKEKLLASIFVLYRGVDYFKREVIHL